MFLSTVALPPRTRSHIIVTRQEASSCWVVYVLRLRTFYTQQESSITCRVSGNNFFYTCLSTPVAIS